MTKHAPIVMGSPSLKPSVDTPPYSILYCTMIVESFMVDGWRVQ